MWFDASCLGGMIRTGFSRNLVAAACCGILLGLNQARASSVAVSLDRAPTIILDSRGGHCAARIVPDAPPRAMRDSIGQIRLLAADDSNRFLTGGSLLSLRHTCVVSLKGHGNADPDAFDDHAWIASIHTLDGARVQAIVHNEFHGHMHKGECSSKVYEKCWENALVHAYSQDGGKKFVRTPGQLGVIAALPEKYTGKQARQIGYFNPTNIVEKDGFVYAMAGLIPAEGRSGICLMRAPRDWTPESWRGWDGSGFTVDLRGRAAGKAELCQPLETKNLFFGVGSLSVHRGTNLFIATMRFNRWDRPRNGEVPGVYISTSFNLVDWSIPVIVLADRDAAPKDDAQQVEYYPALIDDKVHDRNFQTVGDSPLLLTTQMSRSREPWQRRLVARRVQIVVTH
jgi:hypothetical protein